MRSSDLVFLCASATACAGSPEESRARRPPPDLDFACELGVLNADPDDYQPMAEVGEAEVVLGFQGFTFVRLAVRSPDGVANPCRAITSMTVGGQVVAGGQQEGIVFAPDGAGYRTGEIVIYLAGVSIIGEIAEFAVRLEDSERTCAAVGTALLVDRDPCIHTGAEPICPGTTSTGDTGETP